MRKLLILLLLLLPGTIMAATNTPTRTPIVPVSTVTDTPTNTFTRTLTPVYTDTAAPTPPIGILYISNLTPQKTQIPYPTVAAQYTQIPYLTAVPQYTAVPYLTQVPYPTGVAIISEPTPQWTQQSSMAIQFPTPEWTQVTDVNVTVAFPTPEWTQVQPLATVWVYMINWPTPIPTATYTATTASTATPAITLTKTTEGLIKYDDFEDGTAGADYNNIVFTTKANGWKYAAKPGSATLSPLGNISIAPNGASSYLRVTNTPNNSQFRVSGWAYLTSNADLWFTHPNAKGFDWTSYNSTIKMDTQSLLIGGSTSGANAEYLNVWWFIDTYISDASATRQGYGSQNGLYYSYLNTHIYTGTSLRGGISSRWTYADNNYAFIDISATTPNYTTLYYDNLCVSTNRYVTFAGLYPGVRVSLVDPTYLNTMRTTNPAGGSIEYSSQVKFITVETTCAIDLMGLPPGTPVKIKLDTGGWVWYSDVITNIYGGDVWTFSGL